MKHQIGTSETYVEVGQYREMNKGGPLKAFFSMVEYPTGRKTLDCRYFAKGDQRWFSFPSKEIKKQDAEKPEYIPLVSYLDKDYLEHFKLAVLKALKEKENGEANAHKKQAAPLQDDASALWF